MKRLLCVGVAMLIAQTAFCQDLGNKPFSNRSITANSDRVDAKMLMPTSKLIRTTVKDVDGESCGTIQSFVFDVTGKVHYVILGKGGLLGIGEDEIAIPWHAFQCDCSIEGGKMVCHPMVKMSGKQLSTAARIKANNYLELADEKWAAKNASFFKVEKHQMEPLTAGTLQSTYKLINARIRATNNDSAAVLDEFMIQNGTGKIPYVVVGFGGVAGVGKTYAALPFSALTFSSKDGTPMVSVGQTKEQIESNTKVTPSEYPELSLESVKKELDRNPK